MIRGALAGFLLAVATTAGADTKATAMISSDSAGPQANALRAFVAQRKFDPNAFHPVHRDEATRTALQSHIDALAMRLLPLADKSPDKPRVLAEFRRTMIELASPESEDREQAAECMETLMSILGIDSSDGLLNDFVYGFDVDKAVRERQK